MISTIWHLIRNIRLISIYHNWGSNPVQHEEAVYFPINQSTIEINIHITVTELLI